jgi:cell division protein FtsQ
MIVCLIILFRFSYNKQKSSLCKQVIIEISDFDNSLITIDEVKDILTNVEKNIDSIPVSNIPFFEIEQSLENHCYIKNAEVYYDSFGNINVVVENKVPIVRIHKANGDDFYLNEDGYKFPVSSNFTKNVLVASGFIVDSLDLKSILKVSRFVCKNSLWNSQITQVYINNQKEIELIPRVGNHTIILGDVDRLDEKFENLKLFYSQGVKQTGWRKYKEINLKYKNQIVCVKR